MLSKARIQAVRALHQKKERQQQKCFIAEGDKLVRDLLESDFLHIRELYALPEWCSQYAALAAQLPLQQITAAELERISALQSPNQVLAVVDMPRIQVQASLLRRSVCFVLDHIQDPGNLGTIIRISDWFGMPYIFCINDCVEAYNPKTVQSTMGSLARVPVIETTASALRQQFSDIAWWGAVLEGEPLRTLAWQKPLFLVVGNESKGISQEVMNLLQRRITIERSGAAESLNAAIAAGIIAFAAAG
ncbi:MAG: RNA methyltransferase [Sphingobacteriales bacterium]|nr:RNA methyltransferase [Sphingobacteriales bacterium]